MKTLKQPQLLAYLWGGIGIAGLLYVIIAASVQPGPGDAPSALSRDSALLTGEMSDFQYALMPSRAPDIPFQNNGENVAMSDFRGRAVLVNFWATTCTPCLKELPSLDQLEARLGGDAFQVVAIAADPRGPEAARQFLDRLNIENLQLYTDETLRFAASIGGADILPVSILFDANGREVGRLVGEADWASPEAIRLVASARP